MISASRKLVGLMLALSLLSTARAQRSRDPLNPNEADQLRDAAQEPAARLKLYIQFARTRLASLEEVRSDPKVTDRGKQTHDRLQDFLDVYDEMNDNIDTFVERKSDLRKPLKAVVEADTEFQAKLRALKSSLDAKKEDASEYDFLLTNVLETLDSSVQDHRQLLKRAGRGKAEARKNDCSDCPVRLLRDLRLLRFPSCYSNRKVREGLLQVFQQTYRELRPGAPMPELAVEFFAYVNINNTIRMRQGKLFVRLSDLLEGAPPAVLRAIAHILLAKMYRHPIERAYATRYRRYISSQEISSNAHLVRQMRGRKRIESSQGRTYDLDKVFDDLNQRFFFGLLARPRMSWSRGHARNRLGHYDPAHNAIVVSRVFDHPRVPWYAIEYIVYHEMLHLKHPVKLHGSRRCVHPAEFQAEEKLFPHLDQAKAFLRHL